MTTEQARVAEIAADDQEIAMGAPPSGWRFDVFADARLGKSLFQMRPEDWLVRDEHALSSGMEGEGGK